MFHNKARYTSIEKAIVGFLCEGVGVCVKKKVTFLGANQLTYLIQVWNETTDYASFQNRLKFILMVRMIQEKIIFLL